MYLDFLVKIPESRGKITYRKKDESCYIYYEYDRIYDPQCQYTHVKRAMIGKQSNADFSKMQPNQNYLKFFPEVELPEEKCRSARSSCLRIGAYIVLKKLIKESGIQEVLDQYFNERDRGLVLDFAVYSIIAECNIAQYYPDYAYKHPLFTQNMRMYSDSKISDFLNHISDEQTVGFLNSWNESKDHREKIYISYDSTNKNCQAGDIEMVEYGKAKVEQGLPIFNYAIAYDTRNQEPLFYEEYPGSINDVSQLQFMLDKALGYGYKKVGFILDRGYFSKANIGYMDKCGYSFVIMVKGLATLVNQMVLEHRGTFEKKRIHYISEYRVYGITVKRPLYESDEKDRYFHVYYSLGKEHAECNQIENRIEKMTKFLKKHANEVRDFGPVFERYFEMYYDEKTKKFLFPVEKASVIESEMNLCGYFCIITSDKMKAKDAIGLYKSRDVSEKLFLGDKTFLGNSCLRVYSNESASAKVFVEFIALILRSRLYISLKEEMKNLEKRPNYMTVPAALKELEKIEMIRQLDSVYRLDHAVTAVQKRILKSFGMDATYIKYKAEEISEELKIKEK